MPPFIYEKSQHGRNPTLSHRFFTHVAIAMKKTSTKAQRSKKPPLWLKAGGPRTIGLYQYTPSGQFYARLKIRGRLVRRKLGTADFAIAKYKLADFRRNLERTDTSKGNMSFGAVLDDYSATLNGAQSTLEDKRVIIAKLKATFFGCDTLPLRNVRPSQIEAWLSKHYGEKSASAYNSALAVVRAALASAVRDRVITENPVAHIKHKKRATPIRLTPSFEQFDAIVRNIRKQPFIPDKEQSGDFVEFLGLAGLGQAEAAAIKREHVDLDAGRIIVYRHKTDSGFTIPIYPQLRP